MEIPEQPPAGTMQIGVVYPQSELRGDPVAVRRIWLGGHGEAAFARAARLADGFIFFGGGIDHAIAAWKQLRDRVGLARGLAWCS